MKARLGYALDRYEGAAYLVTGAMHLPLLSQPEAWTIGKRIKNIVGPSGSVGAKLVKLRKKGRAVVGIRRWCAAAQTARSRSHRSPLRLVGLIADLEEAAWSTRAVTTGLRAGGQAVACAEGESEAVGSSVRACFSVWSAPSAAQCLLSACPRRVLCAWCRMPMLSGHFFASLLLLMWYQYGQSAPPTVYITAI